MSEPAFRKGIDAFRSAEYEKALDYLNEAISIGGERYTVYDSRAAVYEKLGMIKHALKDSRKVIELAPEMRHGYFRSARLFMRLEKYDTALDMVRLALDRVKACDAPRRTELEGLQQVILDARQTKAALEARTKPHITKLPVELISEVFTIATELDPAVPASVSLVCVHWRSVALSMPSLWRCVILSRARPVKKMELWLERSKQRITALRIRVGISSLQLRDALMTCGPELCKSLTSVHCETDLLFLVSCLPNLPNIKDINVDDIRVSGSSGSMSGNILTPLGPLVPLTRPSSARSLVLEYVTVDWSIIAPQLSQLRVLTIRMSHQNSPSQLLTDDHIRTLLESNPHLEHVVLETESPLNSTQVTTDDRITLPHLSHLELLGPMDADILISRLSLPILDHLVISHSLSAADRALLALDPAFPSLTALGIHNCSFYGHSLAGFLQRLTILSKLEITHAGGNMDGVVDAVNGQSHMMLQHVDFSHCPDLNGGPIVRLVKPRLVSVTDNAATNSATVPMPIKSIQIDGCPRIDPSVPQWLRSRVEKVSCVYMTKAEMKKIRV